MATHKFGKWEYTDEELDQMHAEAVKRGEERAETEPRATAAYYDRALDRIVVSLTNGCTFMFPPALAQGLAGAAAEDLADVRVMPAGFALGWDGLDVHFSIGGLMAGRFGNAKWMAALKQRAGQPATRQAVNGKNSARRRAS